jgi:hypothetical protein
MTRKSCKASAWPASCNDLELVHAGDSTANDGFAGCRLERHHLQSWRVAARFEKLQSRLKLEVAIDRLDPFFLP